MLKSLLTNVLTGGGVLTEVVGVARDWLSSKRKVAEAETNARLSYLQTEQGARHAWNLKSIDASGKGMRWMSFALWSSGIVYAFIDPAAAEGSFAAAIKALPDWYVNGYLMVTGGVWGAKEFTTLRNTSKARKSFEKEILEKVLKDG